MNDVYAKLLEMISNDDFKMLVDADKCITIDEIINFLKTYSGECYLNGNVVGNIIITEGDIITILKIINDLAFYEGDYVLYINEDNIGINTYLVKCANSIYNSLGKNAKISIDYSRNYNKYLNSLVTIIGSNDFVKTARNDFNDYYQIII